MSSKATGTQNPTVLVSWAHRDGDWTPDLIQRRRDDVARLTQALRSFGIDAELDAFHRGDVDWTRWGAQQSRDATFVLIVASAAMVDAWHGSGNQQVNQGAAAEANAIKSRGADIGRDGLHTFCRVLILPNSSAADIPDELDGVERYTLNEFTFDELTPLLRDLTEQPDIVKNALGPLPVFPTDSTVGSSPEPAARDVFVATTAADVARADELRATLNALPIPRPGEGPTIPWFHAYDSARTELAEVEERLTSKNRTSPAGNIAWEAVPTPLTHVPWAPMWGPYLTGTPASIFVHILPLPTTLVTQRQQASLLTMLAGAVRDAGFVDPTDSLNTDEDSNGTSVTFTPTHTGSLHQVHPAKFAGVRVHATGVVSVWSTMVRDHMGTVLDPESIRAHIAASLPFAGTIIGALAPTTRRVAFAIEISPSTSLTRGTVEDLGRRSSASYSTFGREGPRVEPDESLPLGVINTHSDEIGETLTSVLLHGWT